MIYTRDLHTYTYANERSIELRNEGHLNSQNTSNKIQKKTYKTPQKKKKQTKKWYKSETLNNNNNN